MEYTTQTNQGGPESIAPISASNVQPTSWPHIPAGSYLNTLLENLPDPEQQDSGVRPTNHHIEDVFDTIDKIDAQFVLCRALVAQMETHLCVDAHALNTIRLSFALKRINDLDGSGDPEINADIWEIALQTLADASDPARCVDLWLQLLRHVHANRFSRFLAKYCLQRNCMPPFWVTSFVHYSWISHHPDSALQESMSLVYSQPMRASTCVAFRAKDLLFGGERYSAYRTATDAQLLAFSRSMDARDESDQFLNELMSNLNTASGDKMREKITIIKALELRIKELEKQLRQERQAARAAKYAHTAGAPDVPGDTFKVMTVAAASVLVGIGIGYGASRLTRRANRVVDNLDALTTNVRTFFDTVATQCAATFNRQGLGANIMRAAAILALITVVHKSASKMVDVVAAAIYRVIAPGHKMPDATPSGVNTAASATNPAGFVAVGALALWSLTGVGSIVSFIKKFSTWTKTFSDIARGVGPVVEGAEWVAKFIMTSAEWCFAQTKWGVPNWIATFCDKHYGPYRALRALDLRLQAYRTSFATGDVPASPALAMSIKGLVYDLEKLIVGYVPDDKYRKEMKHLLNEAVEFGRSINMAMVNQSETPEALAILLTGTPGIGKTTLITMLVRAIFKKLYPEIYEKVKNHFAQEIFMKAAGSPYWEGYAGGFALVLDDFGQARTVAGQEGDQYNEFLKIVNSFQAALNMANVELKGRVPFTSQLVIATSNLDSFIGANVNIVSPGALARRFRYTLQVALDPKWAIDQGIKTETLDFENMLKQMELTSKIPDCWTFKRGKWKDFDITYSNDDVMTFDELVDSAVEEFTRRHALHARYQAALRNIDTLIERDVRHETRDEDVLASYPISKSSSSSSVTQASSPEPPRYTTSGEGPSYRPKLKPFKPYSYDYYERLGLPTYTSLPVFEAMMDEIDELSQALPSAARLKLHEAIGILHNPGTKIGYDRWLSRYKTGNIVWWRRPDFLAESRARGEYIDPTEPKHDPEQFFMGACDRIIHKSLMENPLIKGLGIVLTLLGFSVIVLTIWGLATAVMTVLRGIFNTVSDCFTTKTSAARTNAKTKPGTSADTEEKVVNTASDFDASSKKGIATKISNNQYLFVHEWEGGNSLKGWVLMLGGRVCLVNRHFGKDLTQSRAERVTFRHATSLKQFSYPVETMREVFATGTEIGGDLLLIRLPPGPEFTNITHLFAAVDIDYHPAILEKLEATTYYDDIPQVHHMHGIKCADQVVNTPTDVHPTRLFNDLFTTEFLEEGNCGTLARVATGPATGHIIGVYVACQKKPEPKAGFFQAIRYDQIKRAFNTFISAPIVMPGNYVVVTASKPDTSIKLPSAVTVVEGLTVVGTIRPPNPIPMKHKIVPSALHTFKGPPEKVPAPLRAFVDPQGNIVDPYVQALTPYAGPAYNMPAELLQRVASVMFKDMVERVPLPQNRVVLTIEEAIMGVDYIDGLDSTERSTSAGYPWSINHQGKSDFMDGPHAMEMRTAVQARIERARNGERTHTVYATFLKAELRTKAKALLGKSRLISGSPMDYSIAFKMYFGDFMRWLYFGRIRNGMAVGVNPYSAEWASLVSHLGGLDAKVIAGDFSAFDAHETPSFMNVFLLMANAFYGNSEDNIIRNILMEEVFDPSFVLGDKLYKWNRGLPSGHPATTYINCCTNLALWYLLFISAWSDPKIRPLDYITPVVYGDDNVVAVKPAAEFWLTQAFVTTKFGGFGYKYTSEDKDTVVSGVRDLRDVTFLKRGFKQGIDTSIVAPLEISTILEMVRWVKDPSKVRERTIDNACTALWELSAHTRDVWEDYGVPLMDELTTRFNHITPAATQMGWLDLHRRTVPVWHKAF